MQLRSGVPPDARGATLRLQQQQQEKQHDGDSSGTVGGSDARGGGQLPASFDGMASSSVSVGGGASNSGHHLAWRASNTCSPVCVFTGLALFLVGWGMRTFVCSYSALRVSAGSWRPLASDVSMRPSGWCAYGSLPGTWVSERAAGDGNRSGSGSGDRSGSDGSGGALPRGARWRVFDERCALRPMLLQYLPDGRSPADVASQPDPPLEVLQPHQDAFLQLSEIFAADMASRRGGGGGGDGIKGGSEAGPSRAAASIVFISDSIDRHLLMDLCGHTRGALHALVPPG
eukprot:351796-Chlamydomonas_euryale.AAC.1